IINSLKNLGKSYSNQELVRKILRCLPKCWTPKVTAIEEAKDISTLPLEQLLGSLMTHETTMKNHENVEVKKKKSIVLKASKEDSESDKDGDVALITSQFKKFLKTTWDDSDPSSSEEESDEEVSNIVFMAIEEENEDEVNFMFDELQNAYENFFNEYENVCLKNKSLKKNVISMSKELEILKSENSKYMNEMESLKSKNSFYINEIDILNVSLKLSNDFEEENKKLKLEIDALKKTFSKFSNSSNKLDNLLGFQRCVFDKAGLGYEEMNN
ncbi:UBN2 domain-containing protein, partial [Cephalotus follicularis]